MKHSLHSINSLSYQIIIGQKDQYKHIKKKKIIDAYYNIHQHCFS